MERREKRYEDYNESERFAPSIQYDGAEVWVSDLSEVALNISERYESYMLAEEVNLFGGGEQAFLKVDSCRGGLEISSLVTTDERKVSAEIVDAIRTNVAKISQETLQAFGLNKELGFHSKYLAFRGASGVVIGLELHHTPELNLCLGTHIESQELPITAPFIESIDCHQALYEFAALWLMIVREAEKVLDTTRLHGSQITIAFQSLLIEPVEATLREELDIVAKIETQEPEAVPGTEIAVRSEQTHAEPEQDEEEQETTGVSFDDIGGNRQAKQTLLELAHSIKHPEILAKWGIQRPNGILLYGPPGTGKSTLVQAFANEIDATMWNISSDQILRKWLGESEANIRAIFNDANEITSTTVMFFDEIDSIIQDPERSHGGGDSARQAVAGIFKQELEKLANSNPNIIVVGATNYRGRLSDALKRSGRFDTHIEVPLPDERDRAEIFTIIIGDAIQRLQNPLAKQHTITIEQLSKSSFMAIDTDVNPIELAAASEDLSGADIRSIINSLLHAKAVEESMRGYTDPITQQDILLAIQKKTLQQF